MDRDWRAASIVILLIAGGNVAYAANVPDLLDAYGPPSMGLGVPIGWSPTVDAGAAFVDVTDTSGIEFTRHKWSGGTLPYASVIGGGIAAGDVDGDGRVDLYFPPGGSGHPAKLYRNLGDFVFEDITDEAGLNVDGFGTGAAFGDHDDDGDEDLYVFIDDRGVLYDNDGTGHFTDISDAAGVTMAGACGKNPCQGTSVAWLDIENDGDLDLYIVNNLDWRAATVGTSGQDYAGLISVAQRQSSVLFENLGNGTFRDISIGTGVTNTGKGLGVAVGDIDGNGHPDIATANDISKNALYLNLGDGGFVSRAHRLGVDETQTSMGILTVDTTGDGRPEILVSNFQADGLSYFLQQPEGWFLKAKDKPWGLGAASRGTGWGLAALDHDLDGWQDIAHAVGRAVPLDPHRYDIDCIAFREYCEDRQDHLFRNLGDGRFGEATGSAGDFAGTTNTRAILAVDLDDDGDEDIVRVNVDGQKAEVLRNDRDGDNGWLQLTFEGVESNRDGYGVKVHVTLPDGRVLMREHMSSGGYQTGLSPVMTVGLAEHRTADVTVEWPSGVVQELGTLDVGRHHVGESG
ncbi:MAG: CRTAC1 family protein [Euryarchaeota archaeon]|nr:CRTAC1 family protein [Euryarchaeota archaeon]